MSFASMVQGISPFGPIFGKELRVSARRKRTYLLRFAYLGLLLLVLLAAFAGNDGFRHNMGGIAAQNQRLSELGQLFFGCFAIFSVVAMGFLGPILTSTAIGSERLQKTLPVLLMTPITAWQIVAGKLLSRMLVSLTLIALGLPVLALVRLLGGVELEQMLGAIALALVAALSSAAIGLFFSTLLNRAYAVILLSYATMLAMYVFEPMVIALAVRAARSFGPGGMMTAMQLVLSTNPYWMVFAVAIPDAWGRGISLPWVWCIGLHLALTTILLICSALILRRHARRSGEKASPAPMLPMGIAYVPPNPLPPRMIARMGDAPPTDAAIAAAPLPPPIIAGANATTTLPPPLPRLFYATPTAAKKTRKDRQTRTVADNPILWRELRRPLFARRWQTITGGILCLLALGVFYCIQFSSGEFTEYGWQIGYSFFFNFLLSILVLVIASTAIAQEKESDTWTLLLTTPVSGSAIVWGKTLGILRRLVWPIVVIVLHYILFCFVGAIRFGVWIMALWIILSFNSVWIASGVYLSLKLRKVTTAVVLNLAIAILVYAAVPAGLAIIGSVTDARKLPEQSLWYLPYYYLGEGLDGMHPRHGDYDYSESNTIRMDPMNSRVSIKKFMGIVLVAGIIHLVFACLILLHTSYHFDKIVGRATQRKRLMASY